MVSASSASGTVVDLGLLAHHLMEAHRAAATLTHADRRQVMILRLAYQLRGVERQSVPELLRGLLEIFSGENVGEMQSQREVAHDGTAKSSDGIWAALDRFLMRYLGPDQPLPPTKSAKLEEGERILDQISHQLVGLTGPDADPNGALSALLKSLGDRSAAVEEAVVVTAQEFFDRLLQALAPDAAREFVGKPGFRPAPIYKAAVFDAYEEKFSQLAEYHGKGRLVRDFKASFKRSLRG